MPPPDPSYPSLRERRAILLVATVGSFITPFMGSAVNVALPAIAETFSLDAVLLSWISTAYLLSAAVFLVPFGKLADIHGRKRVLLAGVITFALASLLSAIATSFTMLLVARVVQGLGGAMLFSTAVAIVTSVYPPAERGHAIGITVAAVYLGLSLGPSAGGTLTHFFGWRSIFWSNTILGAGLVALTHWGMHGEWAEARGEKLDVVGSVIYGVAQFAMVLGLTKLPAPLGIVLLAMGILGLVAFIYWEGRVAQPVLNLGLFRGNVVFGMSNLAAFINYSATFGAVFLLSLYLQYIAGFSPQKAGLILVAQPIMMALLSPFAGRLSDRIEPRVVASIGMIFSAVGLAMLITLGMQTQTGYIVAALLVLGIGFGLFSSPNTNAIMGAVERRYYGVASAITGTMRLTGQVFSMAAAALIFSIFVGRAKITPEHFAEFLHSVRTAFGLFAGLCVIGVFVSLARGKVR